MGLITCPDCGKEISSLAASCINCGRPMKLEDIDHESDIMTKVANGKRITCPVGICTGIIGKDGKCGTCGTHYSWKDEDGPIPRKRQQPLCFCGTYYSWKDEDGEFWEKNTAETCSTLTKCPVCGHQVSDKAQACPSCGAPVDSIGMEQTTVDESKENKTQKEEVQAVIFKKSSKPILVIVGIVIGLIFIASLFQGNFIEKNSDSLPVKRKRTSSSVIAETANMNAVGCVSKDLLSEIIGYIAKNDNEGFAQLVLSGKCIEIDKGERISVINPGFMTATIRYRGQKLYTASEVVR